MCSQVRRFIASIPLIALLTLFPPALAQQKPAAPSRPSQAQLEDRVKQLEARLNDAEQRAASAAMEKDYITRVQKQYETYYEKAFNTQVWTLSILGIFLTVVLGLAGRIGFGIFDRSIQHALGDASAQLRTEFTQMLGKETQALREANSAQLKALEDDLNKRITEQEKDLKTRFDFQYRFVSGLAAGADKRHPDARNRFREALVIYKLSKVRQLIPRESAARAAANIFVSLKNQDEANILENAKKELADALYNDLEGELALAAVDLNWLTPLLKERKAAAPPAAGERP